MWKKVIGIALMFWGYQAHADILFSKNGDDLQITYSTNYNFPVFSHSHPPAQSYYVVFFNAYSSHPGETLGMPNDGLAHTHYPGATVTTDLHEAFQGGDFADIGPLDLAYSFVYSTDLATAAGDTFTISAGTVTIPAWFSSGGVLPDLVPSSVHILDGNTLFVITWPSQQPDLIFADGFE